MDVIQRLSSTMVAKHSSTAWRPHRPKSLRDCLGCSWRGFVAASGPLVYAMGAFAALGTIASLSIYGYFLSVNGIDRPCFGGHPAFSAHQHTTVHMVKLLMTSPGALWMLKMGRTQHHLRLATAFATVNWCATVLVSFLGLLTCTDGEVLFDKSSRDLVNLALGSVAIMFLGSTYALLALTVMGRVQAMENAAMQQFSSQYWWIRWSAGVLILLLMMSFGFGIPPMWVSSIILWLYWGIGGGMLILGLYRAAWMAQDAAAEAKKHAPTHQAQRAVDAANSVRMQSHGGLMALTGSLLNAITQCLSVWHVVIELEGQPLFYAVNFAHGIVSMMDVTSNTICALTLSGALSGAARSALARHDVELRRKQRWRRASMSWHQKATVEDPEQKAWTAKVHELAGRGFTLNSLLKLYAQLGTQELMPSFDPSKSMTRDVVKQALIPLSASDGCAYSDLMMEGEYTRPNKMVTHNWSNLFRDLVGAIVADAIGESDFSKIAYMLTHDMSSLEEWVDHRPGARERTYWVCAFSVNQHRSTCRDCNCGVEKALNNSLPTLPDGRSIDCEMNKFDDMMKYLSATDPDFQQIVAVDSQFVLFTRAWCIAEVAAANEVGMPQFLKISSPDSLATRADALRTLRIQDMEATRPEDKQSILDGIADVDSFNAALQKLLFEDVLPAWNSLDGGEQMDLAGSVIRYHKVCLRTGSSALWMEA